jgi:hypothetical protein
MADRPANMVMDSWRLHCTDGPGLSYHDDFQLFFLKDLCVEKRIALGEFAAQEIDAQTNLELRRVMVERYGVERYLFATGAERVQEDECGVLYRKEMSGDENLAMVQVINSTAEPDGTFKHYFLRVPPQMETAREAVAWTFGLAEHDYEPTLQT